MLVKQFYKHPLIETLSAKTFWGKKRKPKEIPNLIFAKAAVDIFLNAGKSGNEIPANTMSLEGMKQSASESMEHLKQTNEDLARTVKFLVPKLESGTKEVEERIAEYRGNVETWFDATMVQATRLYRKYASAIALALGIGLAVVFNVDSIYIVNQLWRDPTLRQSIVAQAENIKPDDKLSIAETKTKLEALSLPVGWKDATTPQDTIGIWLKILGIFITGTASSVGAPFWFDILNKLLGLKIKKEQKNTEKE